MWKPYWRASSNGIAGTRRCLVAVAGPEKFTASIGILSLSLWNPKDVGKRLREDVCGEVLKSTPSVLKYRIAERQRTHFRSCEAAAGFSSRARPALPHRKQSAR
jgi:hypothetical protein